MVLKSKLYSTFCLVYKLFIFNSLFLSTLQCGRPNWEESYRESAKRSLIPEVDLILVPQKYSLLDEKWLGEKNLTTFNIDTLKKQVIRYGGDWKKFLDSQNNNIQREGDYIKLLTEGTSHYTNYEYDRKIPIVFYGERFFKKGIYLEKIFQQHIVPTLSKILDSPKPNGVILPPLELALEDNWLKVSKMKEKKPEVVLTIIVDQGGLELYKTHPKSFPNIKRLMEKSAYFPNAEVGHLDSHTGVGHTSIGTGAFPNKHEVIANNKTYISFQADSKNSSKLSNLIKKSINVFEPLKGYTSPEELKSESFADIWDIHRKNIPVIISQCYAVRCSIGLAGHGSMGIGGDKDIVYWVEKDSLSWKTNSDLYKLPLHTSNYNLAEYNRKYNKNPWWSSDSKLDLEFFYKNFYKTVSTPTQAKLEGELFRESIKNELIKTGLGKDGETDLLYLTLKASDAVGHAHGWESENARLVLEETDRQVGLIWKMMEEEWTDDYIIVLTADHGAAPLREFSKGMYLKFDDLLKAIQSLLPESDRDKVSLVNFYTTSMLSLNREALSKYGISEYNVKKAILNIQVDGKNFFRRVYTRSDLEK